MTKQTKSTVKLGVGKKSHHNHIKQVNTTFSVNTKIFQVNTKHRFLMLDVYISRQSIYFIKIIVKCLLYTLIF